MYNIPATIRHRIDQLRRRFLWYGGHSVRKKISLVSWQEVCADKDQGGLGLMNLKTINCALLAKWWYRFNDPGVNGKWKCILKSKYGLLGCTTTMSAFWSGVCKRKHIVDLGFSKELGNGADILFWYDRWLSECALCDLFPKLFSIAVDITISVADACAEGTINLVFRRQLVRDFREEWMKLCDQLGRVRIFRDRNDRLFWR